MGAGEGPVPLGIGGKKGDRLVGSAGGQLVAGLLDGTLDQRRVEA